MTDLGIREQELQLYTLESFVDCMRYIAGARRLGRSIKGYQNIEMYMTDEYDYKYDELKYRLHQVQVVKFYVKVLEKVIDE